MTLQTGGSASGEIKTRSSFSASAAIRASARDTTPCCVPSERIKRTVSLLISSLTRAFLDLSLSLLLIRISVLFHFNHWLKDACFINYVNNPADSFTRPSRSISFCNKTENSSIVITPRSFPALSRTASDSASTSLSPTTSRYGIF